MLRHQRNDGIQFSIGLDALVNLILGRFRKDHLGLLLRKTEGLQGGYALVSEIAHGALDDDPHGDRRAFLELVQIADRLTK